MSSRLLSNNISHYKEDACRPGSQSGEGIKRARLKKVDAGGSFVDPAYPPQLANGVENKNYNDKCVEVKESEIDKSRGEGIMNKSHRFPKRDNQDV